MSQYDLSYEEVEKECDDCLFIEVSQRMNDDYIAAGHCLELSTKRVFSISRSDKSDVQKKIEFLWIWKRMNGRAATYEKLANAFLKMEDRFVAESIMKYLSKKRILPQATICQFDPEKAENHYPNWKDLTEIEQDMIRNQLMDENRDIRVAYTVFVARLIQSFKKREVHPRDIQSIIHSDSASEKDQHEPIMVFDFRRDDTISDVFSELSKHCTWFNYDSFEVIVKVLGDQSERKCLKEYKDKHLVPYLKHSIFEIPCATSHTRSQYTKLLLKVSADFIITGREVKVVQRNLAKLLGFKSSTLLCFENYNEGCIELVFSLPTVVLEKSSPDSKLFTYIEWDKSSESYKINADLMTVL